MQTIWALWHFTFYMILKNEIDVSYRAWAEKNKFD